MVRRDMLEDAVLADGYLVGDVPRTPLLTHQTCFHRDPFLQQNWSLRARRLPAFCTLPLRRARVIIVRIALVTRQLATDRCRCTLQLGVDLARSKSAAVQILNPVAFVLAQMRVVHVKSYLAVRLSRLLRLRGSAVLDSALQN
jgi:hypothetical protein